MKSKNTMAKSSRLGKDSMSSMNTMKEKSKLLDGKKLEPMQKNGRECFGDPKGK